MQNYEKNVKMWKAQGYICKSNEQGENLEIQRFICKTWTKKLWKVRGPSCINAKVSKKKKENLRFNMQNTVWYND